MFLILHLFFILVLILTGITDARTRKIPDLFPLLIAFAAVCQIIQTPAMAARGITGLFILSVPMLLLTLKKGGLGGGDIKLTAACGLYLGADALLTGAFLAALFALIALFLRDACQIAASLLSFLPWYAPRQKQLRLKGHRAPERFSREAFAFGPYLAAGFILASLV